MIEWHTTHKYKDTVVFLDYGRVCLRTGMSLVSNEFAGTCGSQKEPKWDAADPQDKHSSPAVSTHNPAVSHRQHAEPGWGCIRRIQVCVCVWECVRGLFQKTLMRRFLEKKSKVFRESGVRVKVLCFATMPLSSPTSAGWEKLKSGRDAEEAERV